MKYTVLGAFISIFSAIVLMFLFSFAINVFFDDPTKNLNIFAGAATSVGAFIGGRYAAANFSSRGLLCGLMTGALTSFAAFFVYILFRKSGGEYFVFYAVNILLRIIFACAGGISAVQKKRNTSPKRNILKKK